MNQIRIHSWFTVRAPRPIKGFIAPPTPDQIERPVAHVDEIDPDILNNLRTLWHGATEDDIVEALISKEYVRML